VRFDRIVSIEVVWLACSCDHFKFLKLLRGRLNFLAEKWVHTWVYSCSSRQKIKTGLTAIFDSPKGPSDRKKERKKGIERKKSKERKKSNLTSCDLSRKKERKKESQR